MTDGATTFQLLMASASSVLVNNINRLEKQIKDLQDSGEDDSAFEILQDTLRTDEESLDTMLDAVDKIRENYAIIGMSLRDSCVRRVADPSSRCIAEEIEATQARRRRGGGRCSIDLRLTCCCFRPRSFPSFTLSPLALAAFRPLY